jgi:hypothetical protein
MMERDRRWLALSEQGRAGGGEPVSEAQIVRRAVSPRRKPTINPVFLSSPASIRPSFVHLVAAMILS